MGATASFDPAYWASTYPEFSYLGEDLAQSYFGVAGQVHDNTGCGPVNDPGQQKFLMHLMTAHICKMFAPGPTDQAGNTQPASEIVGRISSATEGSVSVQTQNEYPPGSAQWYQQTKYGSLYWIATGPFRSFRYVGAPIRRPGMGPAWQYPNFSGWPF